MAKKQAKKARKVVASRGDSSIPAEAGKPAPRPGGRNPQATGEGSNLNKHGGRTHKIDHQRGVLPNSEDGHDKLTKAQKEMVMVDLPYHIRYNNREFLPGHHQVPAHVAQDLRRIIYKKQQADQNIFIGKNKQFRKGDGRSRVVVKHDDL